MYTRQVACARWGKKIVIQLSAPTVIIQALKTIAIYIPLVCNVILKERRKKNCEEYNVDIPFIEKAQRK